MEVEMVPVVMAVIMCVVIPCLFYVAYLSREFGHFRQMGVPSLAPLPGLGNLLEVSRRGLVHFHQHYYRHYSSEKAYGYYEPGAAIMVVRDLDMVQDIMVDSFNTFINRRTIVPGRPLDKMMGQLKDDHWRYVRHVINPAFSSPARLRRMCRHVEASAKSLVSTLHDSSSSAKSTHQGIELGNVAGCFTMACVAGTGFGVKGGVLKDESTAFTKQARQLLKFGLKLQTIVMFVPFLVDQLRLVGLGAFPKESRDYFRSFVDAALLRKSNSNRQTNEEEEEEEDDESIEPVLSKRGNFIQMVVDDEYKQLDPTDTQQQGQGDHNDQLTKEEIQGQGLTFIMNGYDTVTSALSFTLFLVANHPKVCVRLQQEVDTVLKGESPTYDTVQALPYMDMCLDETMRLYPPGYIVERVCSQDCEVRGIRISTGTTIHIPTIGIHLDPAHFPEPEEFDPDRFTAKNKAKRHPFAHLPFGQGPRNCIGMRLAMAEMKIALSAILQELTPLPCDKTVYPPTLDKSVIKAEDGLWVKFVSRKDE